MPYRLLADLVVIVHFAFVLFIAVGSLLAWRWPRLVWLHVPAVLWGAAIITIGFDCPLTPLEKYFRRLAGEQAYPGGFVDHYIENVVYPQRYTPLLRAVAATAIVVGYAGLLGHWRNRHRGVGVRGRPASDQAPTSWCATCTCWRRSWRTRR